tara:strand:+ start:1938 stop:2543 length:606 start_codon:yes stop_codon:yes gene_type:complete
MPINQSINKCDWQYIVTTFILLSIFITTDLLGVFDKASLYYSPSIISKEPYRVLTSMLIHLDLNHLFSNLGGIVITRYLLMQIGMKSKYFYLQFVVLYIFFNFLIIWIYDRILFVFFNIIPNYNYLGFSGVIYALFGFLLLTSFYGKKYFLSFHLNLKRNYEIHKMSKIICLIGLIFSFMPGVSLRSHLSGFITGCFLFFI